jgi:hypothetical protein
LAYGGAVAVALAERLAFAESLQPWWSDERVDCGGKLLRGSCRGREHEFQRECLGRQAFSCPPRGCAEQLGDDHHDDHDHHRPQHDDNCRQHYDYGRLYYDDHHYHGAVDNDDYVGLWDLPDVL